jgi:hypothetical protein
VSPTARAAGTPKPPPGRFLYDALLEFLREDGWPIDSEEEQFQAVAVPVEGRSGRWICGGQIMDDRALLLFSSVVPTFVPEPVRPAVADFLHRANAGLLAGGFQFDPDGGEVRFVTSLDLSDVDPAAAVESGMLPGLIKRMVYANVSTTDQYFSALMSVIHSGVEPAAAVAAAEAQD